MDLEELEVPTNFAGIQLLQPEFSKKVFGDLLERKSSQKTIDMENLSIAHLKEKGLYSEDKSKYEKLVPIDFEPPELVGRNIGEHFYNIGLEASEPYLSISKQFSNCELPPKPIKWSYRPGWTQYLEDGSSRSVDYPNETMVTFDVEVLVKVSPYPILATAASPKYWYSWVSPTLTDPEQGISNELIQWNPKIPNIVVAHNASYDRARISNEYKFKASPTAFLDTMSLHVAVGGLSTIQRHKWMKYRKALQEDDLESLKSGDDTTTANFYDIASINSLQAVAKLYCKVELDKGLRDIFLDGTISDVQANFQNLMEYCAMDVQVTHQVYRQVFPQFLTKCPHPVSFAGMLTLGKSFLPTDNNWTSYLQNAENLYLEISQAVESKLSHLAEAALLHPNPKSDPWLRCLDWTITPQKFTKAKFKKDGTYAKNGEPRPYANQLLPNKPAWYKSCYDVKAQKTRITTRNRLAPYLLKLKWLNNPIYHSKNFGWTFYIRSDSEDKTTSSSPPLLFPTDPNDPNFEDLESIFGESWKSYRFYKIPHKDGEDHRCGNPLSKGYTAALENSTLSSEYPLAKEALAMNTLCAYWISARDRIKAQFVVWQDTNLKFGLTDFASTCEEQTQPQLGMILPQIATMGTVTRRAVEATWMTASNAKPNRIGSELKSLIKAPPNYKIIGADVDSEELWIAALLGDSQFQQHGATAFGWMTLQGTKNEGTDLHSKTAQILGIDRNQAKIFNYGRIYGAGVSFAIQLLRQFNPALTAEEAKARANRLYKETKGTKERSGHFLGTPFWYGGSESFMFNSLELIATSDQPKTPVLNCGIPNALLPQHIGDNYMTSRVNWTVQSSGVDYLHLLLVAMHHLVHKYKIDARFMLSVHDEVRYLVHEKDQYRAALALQVANLWTRALFAYRLGFTNLPQSVAFFSQVDIDFVLRKEVYLDCTTPSQPTKIKEGKSVDMYSLKELTKNYRLENVDLNEIDEGSLTSYLDLSTDTSISNQLTRPLNLELNFQKDRLKFLNAQKVISSQQLKEVCNRAKHNTKNRLDASTHSSTKVNCMNLKAKTSTNFSNSSSINSNRVEDTPPIHFFSHTSPLAKLLTAVPSPKTTPWKEGKFRGWQR